MRRLALAAVLAAACQRSPPSAPGEALARTAPSGHVRLLPAPEFPDAAVLISDRAEQSRQEGRRLVVYVGAPWCEPCRYFHAAAEEGNLDVSFPGLDLLVFDSDRDGARLRAAGYSSRLIPLLALPGPDGKASGRQIEGSIKGPEAVAQITPRLTELLSR